MIYFDKTTLKEIMRDFFQITKIKIVIFDTELNEIASEPETDTIFCATLKENLSFSKHCNECTKKSCMHARQTKKINTYRCHAGLIEAVAPIYINEIHVGYIMLGQVADKNDNLSENNILNYISDYTNNAEKVYSTLIRMDTSHIKASINIMENCIYSIIMKNLINLNKNIYAEKIEEYIYENMPSPLSVDTLCEKFFLSRNMLYKIFRDNFNMTVSKYIKKIRISKAKELISQGISVTNASNAVGFYDYNYFSKVFKKETGILPSKFKKTV